MESDPEAANIIFQITILVILTLINAFFAGSKMAVVSVNKNKIRRLAEQDNKNAALIGRLMKDSAVFLSAIRVAITLAGFFSSVSAATGIAQVLAVKIEAWNMPYSQTLAGVAVTLIPTYFNLVFGELVPKRIALQKAQGFSLFCVRPVYYISRIMNPFIRLLSLSTGGFLKLIGMHSESLETDVSEKEIKSMLGTGSETGVFDDIEKEMTTPIFSFDDERAKEVMILHQDMVAVGINDPMEECIDEVLQSIYSKMPVYGGDVDDIIGILPIKALTIEARRKSFDGLDIRSLLMPPCFVSESQRTDILFREVQKNKAKLVILIDEYGGVAGMTILGDLIEETVGEIHRGYEEVEPEILELGPHRTYWISGSISLFNLKEEVHLHMDGFCDILPDYLMEQLGYIPNQAGLPITVVTEEADYEIEGMDKHMISHIKMTLKEAEKEEETKEE